MEKSFEGCIRDAEQNLTEKNFSAALLACDQAVAIAKEGPEMIEAFRKRGMLHCICAQTQDDYHLALYDLKKVLSWDPKYIDVHLACAMIYRKLQQLDQALSHANIVAETKPKNNKEAQLVIGLVYFDYGQIDKSFYKKSGEYFRRLTEIDDEKGYVGFEYAAKLCLRIEFYAGAMIFFEEAQRVNPDPAQQQCYQVEIDKLKNDNDTSSKGIGESNFWSSPTKRLKIAAEHNKTADEPVKFESPKPNN